MFIPFSRARVGRSERAGGRFPHQRRMNSPRWRNWPQRPVLCKRTGRVGRAPLQPGAASSRRKFNLQLQEHCGGSEISFECSLDLLIFGNFSVLVIFMLSDPESFMCFQTDNLKLK